MQRCHLSVKPQPARARRDGERGVVLATVLVFLVVLALTAALSTALTRTNIKVVNHLQNSKEALQIAEAGVAEALYRLSLTDEDAGVLANPAGTEFRASITPDETWGLASSDPNSEVEIVFMPGAPSRDGINVRTPTLQRPDATSRLPYSTESVDDPLNLTVEWDTCPPYASPGCAAEGAIRLFSPGERPVVKITSSGRSGDATRTVIVRAINGSDPDAEDPLGGGAWALGGDCADGISMNGGASITATGDIYVNAGPNPEECPDAIEASNRNDITAGGINTVGGVEDRANYDPEPSTGVAPSEDPLQGLLPPCFDGNHPWGGRECDDLDSPPQPHESRDPVLGNLLCDGTATNPETCVVVGGTIAPTVLNPGIYYGGLQITGRVTLNPGLYIMAGGGFQVANGNTFVAGSGVTIFNTLNPTNTSGDGAFGQIKFGSGNAGAGLSSPTSGEYQGLLMFQDPANTNTVELQGGTTSDYLYDGIVYAPNAAIAIVGNETVRVAGTLIGESLDLTGGPGLDLLPPTNSCEGPECDGGGGGKFFPIAWQDF